MPLWAVASTPLLSHIHLQWLSPAVGPGRQHTQARSERLPREKWVEFAPRPHELSVLLVRPRVHLSVPGPPPPPPPMQPGVLETAVSFCGDGTERIRLYSLLPRLMGAQTTQPLAFCVFGKNGEILPANRFFWLIPRKMDVFLD